MRRLWPSALENCYLLDRLGKCAGSGLQRWTIVQTAAPAPTTPNQVLANGNYQILVAQGRQNCEQYLLGPGCADANPNPIGGPLLELNNDPRSESPASR